MKKIIYIIMALMCIASCDNPSQNTPVPGPGAEETLASAIAGEWHCTASDFDADIYINFTKEGSFELYQKISDGAHRLYRGSWRVSDEALGYINGKYNDGTEWGSEYAVSMSDDKNHMTMVPRNSAELIEYDYSRQSIPSDVKEKSVVVVKSADQSPVL